jgi:hypothetical protein
MGRVLSNVATSFVHNLLRTTQEPAYLERAVVSDEPLSEVGRDKFLAMAGERGQELLTELDTFLTRLAASERSDTGKKYGVGVYFFEDRSTGRPMDIQHKPYIQKTARRGSPVEEIDVLAGLVPNKK